MEKSPDAKTAGTGSGCEKNFSYFGSAAFAPRHAAEVGVVFPARRLRHGVMSPEPVTPTHTRAPRPPPHSCAALAVAIAAATLTATRSPLACRRPALQGCSWRQEPPSRSSVRGRARPLEATRESVWYIHHEETGYTRALCVRGNSCSEIKSCHQDIARSPAPRAPRRSNHEARLDPRPSRLYRGPEDDRIPPRIACAKAGWRRYWVDLVYVLTQGKRPFPDPSLLRKQHTTEYPPTHEWGETYGDGDEPSRAAIEPHRSTPPQRSRDDTGGSNFECTCVGYRVSAVFKVACAARRWAKMGKAHVICIQSHHLKT